MAGIHIHMAASKQASFREIREQLDSIAANELVAQVEDWVGEGSVCLLAYERYFFRNNSYASLTVFLKEEGLTQTADIIASGGGEGLMNLNFGVHRKMAKECVEALEAVGFTKISE